MGLVLLLFLSAGTLRAQQIPGDPVEPARPASFDVTSTRSIRLFPEGDIFPVYVADPHRPTNAVAVGFYARSRIEQAGSPRTFLAGGGRFGLLRVDSSAPDGRFWQVSIDAGLDALFDSTFKNDALGWDGNYGLTVTTASRASRVSLKAAILHVSTHMGDEYQERTGTRRINYTREEVAVGVAVRLAPGWRTYGEVGYAYLLRSDGQERGRLQGGLEYERRPTVFGGRMAWYGAADFSALQERDWRLDSSFQGGLVARTGRRAYRVYAQWYDGRVPLGQFTQVSEAALSLGLKLDL